MIFLTKQEYKHIRNLAWDLLIDSNTSSLPVNILEIAKLYDLEHLVDDDKPLYENAVSVSDGILKVFGLGGKGLSKYLAVRILAPVIVFKELNVKSAKEVSDLSGLPIDIAAQRYERLLMLQERNVFETSHLESIVLSQFREWISQYL